MGYPWAARAGDGKFVGRHRRPAEDDVMVCGRPSVGGGGLGGGALGGGGPRAYVGGIGLIRRRARFRWPRRRWHRQRAAVAGMVHGSVMEVATYGGMRRC
jgi:hypothetical protein